MLMAFIQFTKEYRIKDIAVLDFKSEQFKKDCKTAVIASSVLLVYFQINCIKPVYPLSIVENALKTALMINSQNTKPKVSP